MNYLLSISKSIFSSLNFFSTNWLYFSRRLMYISGFWSCLSLLNEFSMLPCCCSKLDFYFFSRKHGDQSGSIFQLINTHFLCKDIKSIFLSYQILSPHYGVNNCFHRCIVHRCVFLCTTLF